MSIHIVVSVCLSGSIQFPFVLFPEIFVIISKLQILLYDLVLLNYLQLLLSVYLCLLAHWLFWLQVSGEDSAASFLLHPPLFFFFFFIYLTQVTHLQHKLLWVLVDSFGRICFSVVAKRLLGYPTCVFFFFLNYLSEFFSHQRESAN